MGRASARIEGFRECSQALQSLSKAMARNVGKRALQVPARILLEAAQARAPVSSDPRDKTPGSLRDSGKVENAQTRRGRPAVAVAFTDVAAVPNELGTSKMAANPFFRVALAGVKIAMFVAFADALKVETDAAVQRVAKRAAKQKPKG